MAKFKKKTMVVEAVRFGSDNLPDWFMDAVTNNTITLHTNGVMFQRATDGHCIIKTPDGDVMCNWGDFVIIGADGEISTCKPSIFESTYEAA